MPTNKNTIGNVAIFIAIAALPIIVLIIPTIIPSTKDFLWTRGAYLVWLLEFFAFILGVLSRKTVSGKISIVVSVIISLMLILYLSVK
jgi:hypothetical protein